MLFGDVVIRVPICTKDNSLADEVKLVWAAAEAAVSRIEVVCLAKHSNRGIVIRGAVEYKVTTVRNKQIKYGSSKDPLTYLGRS
jgi:hypothetical protein